MWGPWRVRPQEFTPTWCRRTRGARNSSSMNSDCQTANDLDIRYTLAHLARLDLLVRREVMRLRRTQGDRGDDDFRGLYIAPEEVDILLDRGLSEGPSESDRPTDEDDAALNASLRTAEAAIGRLEAAAVGTEFRLARLGRLFGLTSLELSVVVICLSCEIDLKYEKLFAFLNDDVTKKRPTVDLVMRLLCRTLGERLAARSVFAPDAPLLRWGLVTLHDDPGARSPVLLARYLKLDDHIAGYLLGSDGHDARLNQLRVADSPGGIARPPSSLQEQVEGWARCWDSFDPSNEPVILFHGRYGTGRRAPPSNWPALGRPCLFLDAGAMAAGEMVNLQVVMLAEREACLRDLLVCWCNADRLTDGYFERDQSATDFVRGITHSLRATVILTQKPWDPGLASAHVPTFASSSPTPGMESGRHCGRPGSGKKRRGSAMRVCRGWPGGSG